MVLARCSVLQHVRFPTYISGSAVNKDDKRKTELHHQIILYFPAKICILLRIVVFVCKCIVWLLVTSDSLSPFSSPTAIFRTRFTSFMVIYCSLRVTIVIYMIDNIHMLICGYFWGDVVYMVVSVFEINLLTYVFRGSSLHVVALQRNLWQEITAPYL